ncbi:hypothetical protein R3P38DRAFT_3360708 [Favolaschia claudopus]|uniref:Uncharacterized protein n=1 Tax=Favolaschia claudopus TaxID=2862362 RepID=A0AAW0AWX4_9AGAR
MHTEQSAPDAWGNGAGFPSSLSSHKYIHPDRRRRRYTTNPPSSHVSSLSYTRNDKAKQNPTLTSNSLARARRQHRVWERRGVVSVTSPRPWTLWGGNFSTSIFSSPPALLALLLPPLRAAQNSSSSRHDSTTLSLDLSITIPYQGTSLTPTSTLRSSTTPPSTPVTANPPSPIYQSQSQSSLPKALIGPKTYSRRNESPRKRMTLNALIQRAAWTAGRATGIRRDTATPNVRRVG